MRTNERTNERTNAKRRPGVSTSGIARALEELQVERDHLAARIAKLDALMAQMRDMFHLPARGSGHKAAAPPAALSIPVHAPRPELDKAIRIALHDGPLSPGALATVIAVDRAKLRVRLKQLEATGVIVTTGTTAGRRVALAHYEAAAVAAKGVP
jgi:hypothetical protein